MDRHQIEEISRHLRRHDAGVDTKGRQRTGISMLANAVTELCRQSKTTETSQYKGIAEQLPPIARKLGIQEPAFDEKVSSNMREARINYLLKEMRRDNHAALAPVFIEWLSTHHPHQANALIRNAGYGFRHPVAVEPGVEPSMPLVGIQSSSPYTLERMLGLAQSRLILCAQNHGHMVMTEDEERFRYWPKLLDTLLRGVSIDIVAMHPDIGPRGEWHDRSTSNEYDLPWPSAIALWAVYLRTPEFAQQLDHFWSIMEDWWQMYREAVGRTDGDIGRFRVYGAYFVPNTISVIDHDDESAMLVISPRISDPRSAMRPQFAIQHSLEPSAYAYFFGELEYSFAGHHWAKLLG